MAYGMEVVLGWDMVEFARLRRQLGVKGLPVSPKEWHDAAINGVEAKNADAHLEKAHRACLETIGKVEEKLKDRGYFVVETPLGKRECAVMKCELFYDPHEMGDEPENAVFGVALSGRYYPTLIDWQNAHGTIQPFLMNKETTKLVDLARREVVKRLPIFDTACLGVVMKFY